MKKLQFVDETFRDAPQSVWATRMKTEWMLSVAPYIDQAGFQQACVTSAAAFETAVMYLFENPWERLRLLKKLMPNTDLSVLIRGRNMFGWQRYPNDVVELTFKCLKDCGMQWVMPFDGLNDLRNIEWHIKIAKKLGLNVLGELVFAVSPVHTDEYFAGKVREFVKMGVDAVVLEDASGVLTPERTRTLVPALRQVVGDVELQFHSHCSTGMAPQCYEEAIKLGVDTVCTASLPIAYGESLPATVDILSNSREMGFQDDINELRVREADDYLYWIAYQNDKPLGNPVKANREEYERYVGHQIPGGMMSNFVRQLTDLGLIHKLPEVLGEATRVRAEIGYPVMVTPFSQWVGVQAIMNIIEGQRYNTVPQELRLYARGYYGRPPAPIDPNVLDVLMGDEKPIDCTEKFEEPILGKIRADQNYKSDEELLLNLFNNRTTMEKFYQNRETINMPVIDKPLSCLIKEMVKRRDIKTMGLEKGIVKIGWAGF